MNGECKRFLGCSYRRAAERSAVIRAEERETSIKVFKKGARGKSPSFALIWVETGANSLSGTAFITCMNGRTGNELTVRLGLVKQGNEERLAEQAVAIAIIHLAL